MTVKNPIDFSQELARIESSIDMFLSINPKYRKLAQENRTLFVAWAAAEEERGVSMTELMIAAQSHKNVECWTQRTAKLAGTAKYLRDILGIDVPMFLSEDGGEYVGV